MATQNRILEEMKERAESLWRQLLAASGEKEKASLREKYRAALETYQRQCLIADDAVKARAEPTAARTPAGNYPNPFEFHDYRDFLLAWLKSAEASPKSLKAFVEKSDVTPEELARVLKRWEPMSGPTFRKILKLLNLRQIDAEYLEALHSISDTSSKSMRDSAIKRLQTFSEFRKAHPPEYEAWRYLSHWYYVAIREMSWLPGFRPEAEWIQGKLRFPVTLGEIKAALKFLVGAGFFRVRADGVVEPLLKRVRCAGGVFTLALGQYHRELLAIASESIRAVPARKRIFLGQTMALSKENFDRARRIIEEAYEKIASLDVGDSAGDEVYHFELVGFPLSESKKSGPF